MRDYTSLNWRNEVRTWFTIRSAVLISFKIWLLHVLNFGLLSLTVDKPTTHVSFCHLGVFFNLFTKTWDTGQPINSLQIMLKMAAVKARTMRLLTERTESHPQGMEAVVTFIAFVRQIYEDVSKSFRTDHLERELQMIQLSAVRCSCIAILWVSLVSFATITLCVASQRVFIVDVYFVIDSVRNLLDTPSYKWQSVLASSPFGDSWPYHYDFIRHGESFLTSGRSAEALKRRSVWVKSPLKGQCRGRSNQEGVRHLSLDRTFRV